MSFIGKVVIVTGGASGIGAATALNFAKQGANVVIVDKNKEKLIETAKKCAEEGQTPITIDADITNDKEVLKIVEETLKVYGKIDVLINNAGILRKCLILNDDLMTTYDELMNTNLRSVLLMTNTIAPHLIKTNGSIVNVSSSASVSVPLQDYAVYSLSKNGVDFFTRCAANQLAEFGVRVNAVNPGPVKTDLYANAGEPISWEVLSYASPLKRLSDPIEIADLIVFLASEKAKSITGACYLADNGLCLSNVVSSQKKSKM